MPAKRHAFKLTLEADGKHSEDEAIRSLRAFLKSAWRCYGLKCTSAEQARITNDLFEDHEARDKQCRSDQGK